MAGGYFGNRYFPQGYFPDSYFGTVANADPNAMRGTAAGTSSASGTLSAAQVQQPEQQPKTGGGGRWVRVDDDGIVRITLDTIRIAKPTLVPPVLLPLVDAGCMEIYRPEIVGAVARVDDTMEILALLMATPAAKDEETQIMKMLNAMKRAA